MGLGYRVWSKSSQICRGPFSITYDSINTVGDGVLNLAGVIVWYCLIWQGAVE